MSHTPILPDSDDDDAQFDELHPDLDRGQYDVIKRAPFTSSHLIDARLSSTRSLFTFGEESPDRTGRFRTSTSNTSDWNRHNQPVQLRIISGSLVGPTDYAKVYDGISGSNGNDFETNQLLDDRSTPTIAGVARKVAARGGVILDEKPYITYELICCTFLLGLVQNGMESSPSLRRAFQDIFIDYQDEDSLARVVDELKVRGGRDQLIMFLTGPAGAGKSAAIKVARRFCFDFSRSAGLLWSEYSFLFTAYTGTAAMEVGGLTICKAAFIFTTRVLTEEDKRMWRDVKILIIDEISFMSDKQLQELDKRLKCLRDKNKPFGGFSIVFVGDFRQMEPCGEKKDGLLFSRLSSQLWDSTINTIIILNNDHRFKEDPEYGRMMKSAWKNDLTRSDRDRINTRLVKQGGLSLPKQFSGDACYACPTNRERNAISAGNFHQHVLDTHPAFASDDPPPTHTIVIEAHITSSISEKKDVKIDNVLRHRILTTCGDDNVKYNSTQKVDPALCLYVGAYLMCVLGNEHLRDEVPRGNGTLCRLIHVKLKNNHSTYKYKNYYGKKVWTVCASDVEWIEVEHVVKTEEMIDIEKRMVGLQSNNISLSEDDRKRNETVINELQDSLERLSKTRRFKMNPHTKTVHVRVKPHNFAKTRMEFKCRMHQLPVNLNDATTGHKLQGMSKDVVIITSWPKGGLFNNWEYTVLSRVRTLEGLFIFEEISLDKSFAPSDELKLYFRRAKNRESTFLKNRARNIERFYSRSNTS